MWIFLPNSFLSIVDKGDPTGKTLLVRGRIAGDIESLFPKAKIEIDVGSDYRFRARIDRKEVVTAVAESVRTLYWPNFKDQVKDKDRHEVYLDVWHAMFSYQQRARKREFGSDVFYGSGEEGGDDDK